MKTQQEIAQMLVDYREAAILSEICEEYFYDEWKRLTNPRWSDLPLWAKVVMCPLIVAWVCVGLYFTFLGMILDVVENTIHDAAVDIDFCVQRMNPCPTDVESVTPVCT